MEQQIVLLLIGGIGGILSGFLGIGGGVVLIPLLVYWGGISVKAAASVSLVVIIFASLSGIYAHRRNIDLKIGAWLAVSSVVGALAGAYLGNWVSEVLLKTIFMLVVLAAALMLVLPRNEGCESPKRDLGNRESGKRQYKALLIGLGQGILTGMLGVGGGFIIVPLMICFLDMPTVSAIGTSLAVIFFSGLSGLVLKAATHQVVLATVLWVILGAVPGAQIGAWAANNCQPRRLQLSLLILLLIILGKMVWEEFLCGIIM